MRSNIGRPTQTRTETLIAYEASVLTNYTIGPQILLLNDILRFTDSSSYVILFWALHMESFMCDLTDVLLTIIISTDLVPPAGLEPARLKAKEFKSYASTISPRGHLASYGFFILRQSLF